MTQIRVSGELEEIAATLAAIDRVLILGTPTGPRVNRYDPGYRVSVEVIGVKPVDPLTAHAERVHPSAGDVDPASSGQVAGRRVFALPPSTG